MAKTSKTKPAQAAPKAEYKEMGRDGYHVRLAHNLTGSVIVVTIPEAEKLLKG